MYTTRIKDVIHCAWSQSQDYTKKYSCGNRLWVLLDMIYSYLKYGIWTNQYMRIGFYQIRGNRHDVVKEIVKINKIVDRQRLFLKQYGDTPVHGLSMRYQEKRVQAFYDYFNDGKSFIGKGLRLVGGAKILRDHVVVPLSTINIGRNFYMFAGAYVDYTGNVRIGDNVCLSEDVLIYTHEHDVSAKDSCYDWSKQSAVVPKSLEIGDGVWIGARSIILSSCNTIGRGAIIGSGCVVRKSVPPYSVVAGNPAKVVGFRMDVDQIIDFEKNVYCKEERIDEMTLRNNYNKYFQNRVKDIVSFIGI